MSDVVLFVARLLLIRLLYYYYYNFKLVVNTVYIAIVHYDLSTTAVNNIK